MSVLQQILDTKSSAKALSRSIFKSTFGELPIILIGHKICSAAIALQGAQLLFWQPKLEPNSVIWLSEKAVFKKGVAIRGGVPICWPWFGKAAEPAHGFVRTMDWQLDSFHEDVNGVDLVLSLTDSPLSKPFFDQRFELRIDLHLGRVCTVELHAWGDFNAVSALHTYFNVNNINKVTVKGLGDKYQEKLTTNNKPTTPGQLTFNQAVDRIYTDPEQHITLNDGLRTVKISSYNASDVVTWNPWADQSKAMLDVEDDGYQKMVCVETARINRPIELSPTKKSSYGFKLELI